MKLKQRKSLLITFYFFQLTFLHSLQHDNDDLYYRKNKHENQQQNLEAIIEQQEREIKKLKSQIENERGKIENLQTINNSLELKLLSEQEANEKGKEEILKLQQKFERKQMDFDDLKEKILKLNLKVKVCEGTLKNYDEYFIEQQKLEQKKILIRKENRQKMKEEHQNNDSSFSCYSFDSIESENYNQNQKLIKSKKQHKNDSKLRSVSSCETSQSMDSQNSNQKNNDIELKQIKISQPFAINKISKSYSLDDQSQEEYENKFNSSQRQNKSKKIFQNAQKRFNKQKEEHFNEGEIFNFLDDIENFEKRNHTDHKQTKHQNIKKNPEQILKITSSVKSDYQQLYDSYYNFFFFQIQFYKHDPFCQLNYLHLQIHVKCILQQNNEY